MIIGVAGPYSAPSAVERRKNSDRLTKAAARLLEMGHIPFVGVNAAVDIVEQSSVSDAAESMMQISLALMDACDALLFLGESPGANRERELFVSKGLPVYYSISEIPGVMATP
jgi:hypothetical protein